MGREPLTLLRSGSFAGQAERLLQGKSDIVKFFAKRGKMDRMIVFAWD